jgi:membrane-associated phospholipid phosphatase
VPVFSSHFTGIFKSFFTGICLLAGLNLHAQGLSGLDRNVFLEAQTWRSGSSDGFFEIYSATVLPAALLVPAGTFAALKLGGIKDSAAVSAALKTTAAAGAGFVLSRALKHVIQRPRPYATLSGFNPVHPLPDQWSMPSGHTSVAFSTAVSLCLEFPRWEIITPSLLWAGGVGFSRVMLGHHYPGDVLAGAVLGAGSAWLTWKAGKFLNTVRSRHSGKRKLRQQNQ